MILIKMLKKGQIGTGTGVSKPASLQRGYFTPIFLTHKV